MKCTNFPLAVVAYTFVCNRSLLYSRTRPCLLMQLWEQLLFDSAIKERLLGYATSALLFVDRGVAPAVVGINRVALLHGCRSSPPLASTTAWPLVASRSGAVCLESLSNRGWTLLTTRAWVLTLILNP